MFFLFFFFLFASVHTPPHQRRLVSGARVGGSAVVTRWAPFYAPTTFQSRVNSLSSFFFGPFFFILFVFLWNLLPCYNIRHSQWFRFFSQNLKREREKQRRHLPTIKILFKISGMDGMVMSCGDGLSRSCHMRWRCFRHWIVWTLSQETTLDNEFFDFCVLSPTVWLVS